MSETIKRLLDSVSTAPPRCVEYLLRSGLLLDEDVECILMQYTPDDDYYTNSGISVTQKVLGVISLASATFMAHQKFAISYLTVVASPVIFISLQYLGEVFYRKKQKGDLETLTKMLRNTFKMNRGVVEFYKKRNITGAVIEGVTNPYTQPFQHLIKAVFEEEVEFITNFRELVPKFGEYVPYLRADYAVLEQIELDQFAPHNIASIDDCVLYLQKLCDIYVLVVSNILTCLAITACPDAGIKYGYKTDQLLDTIVPKMKTMIIKCYNNVEKKFNDIKFYYVARKQAQEILESPRSAPASRLSLATYDLMSKVSELIEKSRLIYDKMKQDGGVNDESELKTMSVYIENLHKETLDYCQSLHLLQKLFEFEINKSKLPNVPALESSSKSTMSPTSGEATVVDASLNSTEPTDDEEYELFIPVHEILPETSSFDSNEEQELRKYAAVVGQELKQTLKTHSRFVAARKKRGITDEEPEKAETVTSIKVEAQVHEVPTCGDSSAIISDVPPPPLLSVPPPPPPPLPVVHVDTAAPPDTGSHFLDIIRALPRQNEEETFE
ncbi:hypothetical protein Zmor_002980 [Zophobas morio]|uniref:Uncharacterized protein n=1 Tax=Zophobas morio TaxID=2755281 RepID=A0AA38M0S6_9CUCU|nr:hypothetical protein Zmor_002980 [Zophobas morio]